MFINKRFKKESQIKIMSLMKLFNKLLYENRPNKKYY